MNNILEILYNELSQMESPDYPGRKNDVEEYLKMCNIIKQQHGTNFIDRLEELQRKRIGHDSMDAFLLGFRACAQLVREVLG